MTSYDTIESYARILKVAEKLRDNTEFIEVKVGSKELGGFNLRIKGKTVYCNIADIPSFQFDFPQEFVDNVLAAIPLLKAKLQELANE